MVGTLSAPELASCGIHMCRHHQIRLLLAWRRPQHTRRHLCRRSRSLRVLTLLPCRGSSPPAPLSTPEPSRARQGDLPCRGGPAHLTPCMAATGSWSRSTPWRPAVCSVRGTWSPTTCSRGDSRVARLARQRTAAPRLAPDIRSNFRRTVVGTRSTAAARSIGWSRRRSRSRASSRTGSNQSAAPYRGSSARRLIACR